MPDEVLDEAFAGMGGEAFSVTFCETFHDTMLDFSKMHAQKKLPAAKLRMCFARFSHAGGAAYDNILRYDISFICENVPISDAPLASVVCVHVVRASAAS